jgi:tetratricopeptide (TPR) repeat protein
MRRALTILLAVMSAGCAYYNAMWSAERYAKDARRAERRGQVAEARSQWAQAAVKAERVAIRHPRSRWADDALTLQAEGLARSGSCDEAGDVIKRVRETVSDRALLEGVSLVDAECALNARQPVQALSAVGPALASRDESLRSRAELLAGHAAAALLDYDAAVTHFERSRETAARPALARVLITADRPTDATRVIESLTGVEYATDRPDLLTRLAGTAGPAAASTALDRLLARGKRIQFQELAQLLIADADRRFANGDYEAAAERYQRAATLAPAATSEAGLAALGTQRVLLTGVRDRAEVKPIEAALARLSMEPGAVAAKRLLDLVRQVTIIPETPAAGFRAAEVARDSLSAPALAGSLFLDGAERDTASIYAPKALVAAISLLPDRRDSIVAVLDARYATSPYTRAFYGEASVAYAAAEDSLARELGVQIARTAVPLAGRRIDMPLPGPRGPHLEDVEEARGAARGRTRPANRPAAAPGRDRPATPTGPERP